MRLASFLRGDVPSFGVVVDNGVVDLLQAFNGEYADLKSLIAANGLSRVTSLMKSSPTVTPIDKTSFLPVIPNPEKIVCVGLNYGDHVRETGKTVTESPALFLRLNQSQVAHEKAIIRPAESQRLDYEGEIAVIIGKAGRRISEADAWSHIAGYSCYNDGTLRDWQVATSQWTPGKNFFRTGGFGPWMVTSDEIEPDQRMTLITRLNGQEMQRATTDLMIHSIPRQIAYISAFIPLEPGDVIVTGTPGGVGNKRTPPVFMKPGDVVEIEVDAVGVLRNYIADETSGT